MAKRDEFSEGTKRTIAFRVNGLCSFPDCRKLTYFAHSDDDKHVTLGQACHITAAAPGGPRYDESLTPEARREPNNGIWMCLKHARLIDADEKRFPADLLRRWKAEMEAWVKHHRPNFRDRHAWELGHQLETTLRQRDGLIETRSDTTAIDARILTLKRDLRHGPQLNPGEFLGDDRYQLIRQIGQGGFATVWLAHDRREDTQVAIKVLHGQFSASEERRERLFRGARQMARLDHAHIVKVMGAPAIDDGWAYFVMEYVDGGDFRRAVLDGRLDLDARLDALEKIALALDDAHALGLVHRDVKPANILLGQDGVPKLTDFDLVRAADTTGLTRTRAGMGSYVYAAPESMEDAARVDSSCDVYSLAATWVFAALGRELNSRFLLNRAGFLKQLDIPGDALDVLKRALHLDPQERPSSAVGLCRELQTALGDRRQDRPTSAEALPTPSIKSKVSTPARSRTSDMDLFRKVITKDGEVDFWCEIPAGTGWIGSPKHEEGRYKNEGPRHRVEITRPFWMSAVPITNTQFGAFDRRVLNTDRPDHPVTKVNWNDATAFCRWLADKMGFRGARLPTEEEWEYACRAGRSTRYWNGDAEADLAEVGWYDSNSGGSTHAVGEKAANPWGLYDTHGNIREWTASLWTSDYSWQTARLTIDPADTPGDLAAATRRGDRVFRGGGFWNSAQFARSAYRSCKDPGSWVGLLGFRVLLPVAPSDV